MLRNYVTIGLRMLRRNPVYTLINIIGLSIGIASCLVIFLFVQNERSFDSFHQQGEEIYRVFRIEHRVGRPKKISESTASPLADAIKESVPGVEAISRYLQEEATLIVDNHREEITVSYVDSDFLRMFDFTDDSLVTSLDTPGVIVLTQAARVRYFGKDVSVGSVVEISNSAGPMLLTVAGIIGNPPVNSSFQFDFLTSYRNAAFYSTRSESWSSFSPSLYLKKNNAAEIAGMERALNLVVQDKMGDQIQASVEAGWLEDREDAFALRLQPLADVHLSPEVDSFHVSVSDARYSYILLAIAFGILLIACVNFISQSIGRARTRQREVEMRRSLGADSLQLVQQFWGESLLITTFAAVLGLIMADGAVPIFNHFADQQLSSHSFLSPGMIVSVFLLVFVCSVVAGLYPSIFLAGNSVSKTSVGGVGKSGNGFVKAVVIGQFALSIGMIAAVLIMHGQMNFIDTQDLGFEAEEIVLIDMNAGDSNAADVADLFQAQVAMLPDIVSVSGSSSSFGDNWSRTVLNENDINHIVYMMRVDPEFLETTGIQLTLGRNLSLEHPSDVEGAIVVNQAFVDALGYANPIGTIIPELDSVQVVGVVENFKFLSFREEVPPTVMHMSPQVADENYSMVRFATGRVTPVMTQLREVWSRVQPDQPFVAQFMDDRLHLLYASERRWQQIITFAASLALMLSCLGLFGIAMLSASQKTKEIGIRKVLGSSIAAIVLLLSKDYLKIVGFAFALSVPVCWILMDQWLDTFAYRVDISAAPFILAGLATLAIALLTVSHRSLVAALANPVESLRSE